MNTNASRLRYISSHYLQLQGLRLVAVGIMLLFLLAALRLQNPWNAGLFALLLALLGLSWRKIGAYYERRVGFVEQRPLSVRRGVNLRFLAILLLVLLVAFAFRVRIAVPEWILGLTFAGLWALEERRWYYLLFAAAFVAVAVIYRTPHPRLWSVELWLMPLGLIVGGMLDHRYLLRSLPGVRSNGRA